VTLVPSKRAKSIPDCYNCTHTLPATVAKLDELDSIATEIKSMLEAGSLSAATEPPAFHFVDNLNVHVLMVSG
jgi:hypothetical protein